MIAGVLALEPVEEIAGAIGRDAAVIVQHLNNIAKKFDLFARMLRHDAGRS